ncbi:hypothetical protein [Phenylobacterium sp.]|jgi:hypothetical protein|uniref:hypothetical protein n=1 Tax=Phenylobacterium sp. TaxID=1871053 RepID=UPI003784F5C9
MEPTPQIPQDKPPQDRRLTLALVGAAIALLAGLAIAWSLLSSGGGERTPPPPASQGGLVIDSTAADDSLDPAKALRCFVAGQFVGEFTLAECARRNGVATDALDVGVDETGALAAADQAGTMLTPLPPQEEAPVQAAPPVSVESGLPGVEEAALGACWRYAGGRWRRLPGDISRNACAQVLFAGRCEQPGGATYGRWGQQTLRLVPGRVEVSDDNRSFRPLIEQGPGCTL